MDSNYRTKFIDENLEILECIHPSYQLLNEKILKESLTFNYCHGDEMVMMDGVSTSNVKALQTTAKTIMSHSIGEIYHWILKTKTSLLLSLKIGWCTMDRWPHPHADVGCL